MQRVSGEAADEFVARDPFHAQLGRSRVALSRVERGLRVAFPSQRNVVGCEVCDDPWVLRVQEGSCPRDRFRLIHRA